MEAANELGGFTQEAEEILADTNILEAGFQRQEATDLTQLQETVLETAGMKRLKND